MENKSLVDIPPSYVSGELTQLARLYKFIKKETEKTFKESSKLEINGYIYAKKDRTNITNLTHISVLYSIER